MENQNNNQTSQTNQDPHYTKEQRRQFSTMQKRIVFQRRRLAFIFFVAVAMVGVMGVNIFSNLQQLDRLESELVDTKQQQEALTNNQEFLTQEVNKLKDEEYLGKVARKQYYYSREGETVYHFPQLEKETKTTDEN